MPFFHLKHMVGERFQQETPEEGTLLAKTMLRENSVLPTRMPCRPNANPATIQHASIKDAPFYIGDPPGAATRQTSACYSRSSSRLISQSSNASCNASSRAFFVGRFILASSLSA